MNLIWIIYYRQKNIHKNELHLLNRPTCLILVKELIRIIHLFSSPPLHVPGYFPLVMESRFYKFTLFYYILLLFIHKFYSYIYTYIYTCTNTKVLGDGGVVLQASSSRYCSTTFLSPFPPRARNINVNFCIMTSQKSIFLCWVIVAPIEL